MYILGINISHHSSCCLLKDGEILFYSENDRLSRKKLYDYQIDFLDHNKQTLNFFQLDLLKKHTTFVDYIIFTSYGQEEIDVDIINAIGKVLGDNGIKYNTKLFYHENHHLYHAASAFYGSGFEDAVALVMDGGGSYDLDYYKNNLEDTFEYPFRESESIYKCSYNKNLEPLFKHYSLFDVIPEFQNQEIFLKNSSKNYPEIFTHSDSCGNLFATIVDLFNTGSDTAGKIMGLSSYTSLEYNEDTSIEGEISYELKDPWFYEINGEWVTIPSMYEYIFKIMNRLGIDIDPDFDYFEKNGGYLNQDFIKYASIAAKVQDETEKHTVKLIKKAISLSGSNNIVLSGGYFLNCVNNYRYLKHFPNVNFYIDPISHDGGTCVGAAKWLWHGLSGDKTIRPLTNLYLG